MNLKTFAPTALRETASDTCASALPVPCYGYRILVADDNESVCLLLSCVLASEGFAVDAASDGEEAWDELHHKHYDLLVTDHDMPRLMGLRLIERIRKAGMKLPVILASGSLSGETARDYPQLQIAAVIPKPFNLWEFVNIVRKALGITAEDATAAKEVYANSPAPRPAALARTAPPLHIHVLIADDDAVVRGSLAAVLQSEGYEVDEASNGIEAVTRAIRQKPDLVLLDLNMPHADGWTAFNQLDRITPLLPVIVITARPNQYKEAVRVGVDAFMEKPLNIPVLVQAVKRLTNEDEHRHDNRITKRTFVTQLLRSNDA